MTKVDKNVPELRFKGFSDPWEQRKLKNITDKVSVGIATSSSQYFSKREHGVPFIKNQNIKENWIDDRNLEYISQDFDKANSTKRIKAGDILTVRTGYPGLSAVVPKKLEGAQTFTTLITRVKKGLVIPEFVSIFINSDAGKKQILGMEAGGAQKNVNAGILQNLSIPVPSLVEQKKISNFVIELDKTIDLHQRKLTMLKRLKQTYLKQIFQQNSQNVPTLRFTEFSEPWDQRKLGDLAEIVRGSSPRPIQDPKWFDSNSNVGWLRISDVTEQNGRIKYLDQKISKLGQEKTRVLSEPHLLLSIAATVGKPVINYVCTGVHDGFLIFLNSTFDREYMFQWLEMFRPNWQNLGQPGSQINLNSELVRNQDVMVPCIEEQIKIGLIFKQFDDAINLHQQKVSYMQTLKSCLLDKMFF